MNSPAISPTGPAATTPAPGASARIVEIDMLRGLVIVLMALDHVRDYFYLGGGFAVNPLDPDQATPWLYLTRWVTHLCAPTFVLLAGVSAYLQHARGKTTPQLSRFLLARGVWLIALELTLLSFGWSFSFPPLLFLQVIWAIGWSMIALAGLIWLPRAAVLAIGIALLVGHNVLDPINAADMGTYGPLWQVLHDGGPIFAASGQPVALVAYPLIPWMGVIAVGYGMGAVFLAPAASRDRTLLLLGLVMLAAFVVLRGLEAYGNPSAGLSVGPFGAGQSWRAETSPGDAAMVFFDVQKYPPSLQFLLVTLGIVFVLWRPLSRLRGAAATVLGTFGAVPFFFYILHVYVVHLLAIAANAALGRDVSGFFDYLVNGVMAPQLLAQAGFTLPWIYVAWCAMLAALYLPCRWWAGLKARRRDWWLSYL